MSLSALDEKVDRKHAAIKLYLAKLTTKAVVMASGKLLADSALRSFCSLEVLMRPARARRTQQRSERLRSKPLMCVSI
jgi:hypothetical protein